MAITLKEVAARAGVSRSAVSRAFTKGASVAPKTRLKIEKAAKELGYSPNALARGLTTGRTKLIGLISNNFSNPVFLEIFDLFTRGLQSRGLRPLLVNLTDETDAEYWLQMLKTYSVDGVIIASSTLDPRFSLQFHEAGLPTIQVFGRFSNAPVVHNVGVDNVACGRLGVQVLHERGYRHIGFLGGPRQACSTQDRCRGFQEQAALYGDVKADITYCENYSFKAGRAEMMRLIGQKKPAEAYVCGDDVLAIGALSALRDAGYLVPEDIGLIGLNDMEMAGWENIGLTTVRQPFQEIISSTIELMASLLENPDRSPETRLFSCRIVERRSLRRLIKS